MGGMTSLSSYNRRNKPLIVDNILICFLNSLVSFISGFAVWTVVGYMLKLEGDDISIASIGLVFITYPTAITTFASGQNAWTIILGFVLFTLGIDSAFTITEAVATVICDTPTGAKVPRMFVAFVICLCGFLMSIMFCTNWGFILFDSVDHYLSNYLLLLIGI